MSKVKNIWRSWDGDVPIITQHKNRYQALFELYSKEDEFEANKYNYFATEFTFNAGVISVENLKPEIDDFKQDLEKEAEEEARIENFHIQQESRMDLFM